MFYFFNLYKKKDTTQMCKLKRLRSLF